MSFTDSFLLQKLANKSISKEDLLKIVEADFSKVPELFVGVSSKKAAVRYSCASLLVSLSSRHPQQLYPYMDRFIALLNSKYRILTWNAIAAIANLCCIDKDKKFDAIFDKYFGNLNSGYLVTAANVVGNSGKIAVAKPYLIPKITCELLKVENIAITPHLTQECKRVLAELAVKTFNMFYDKMGFEEKGKVHVFVKRQLDSPRKRLKAEAETFLKKWNA